MMIAAFITAVFAFGVFIRWRRSTVMLDLLLLIMACHAMILVLVLNVVVGRRCCFYDGKSSHLLLRSLFVDITVV